MIMAGRADVCQIVHTLNRLAVPRYLQPLVRLSFGLTDDLCSAMVFVPLPIKRTINPAMSTQQRLDVFRVYPNGDVLWLTSARSVERAKAFIQSQSPGEYLILDHDTGARMIVESGYRAAGGGE